MAILVNSGAPDTAIEGYVQQKVDLAHVNFGDDHKVVSEKPGELITANVLSPFDQPEMFRISQRKIPDMYANTAGASIDASARLASRAGLATLLEVQQTWSEYDPEDPTYRKLVPVRCGISFSVPTAGSFSSAEVWDLLIRTFSLLYPTGESNVTRIQSLMHGVLRAEDQ